MSASLERIFGREPEALQAHLARLSVLYEDLHLELTEASQPDLKDARRTYFVRRSIATLLECMECLIALDGGADFRRLIWPFFTANERGQWNTAIAWCREHKQEIQNVRNDFGGHFSHGAALYAVRHAKQLGSGSLEAQLDLLTGRASVRFKFAGEIAAMALAARRQDQDMEAYIVQLIATMFEGYRQSVGCMHLVLEHYLAPSFGFPRPPKR
jgi:hypothetical protein